MKSTKFIALALFALISTTAHAAPTLQFGFNETGTTSTSTGTVADVLSTINGSGTAIDIHTAAGGGVAGDIVGHSLFGIDRGLAFNGNSIAFNSTSTVVSGFSSWTVSGWYKSGNPATTGLTAGGALFQSPGNSGFGSKGFAVRGEGTLKDLRIGVVGTTGSAGTSLATNHFDDLNTWTFFAVTYDGTLTSNNVKIYQGFRNATEAAGNPFGVTLVDTATVNAGTALATIGYSLGARFGDANLYSGTFASTVTAVYDNFRIEGVTSGNGGVLNLAALEAYRSGDIAVAAAVPEPGTFATIGLLGIAIAWKQRRKKFAGDR
ncbi:MAG: hypothetical protein QM811_11905 [Pirellulales bacterium]